MGTEKRQRQKEQRAARLAAEAARAKAQRRNRLIRNLGITVVVVFAAAFILSLMGGNDGEATTTTLDLLSTTTTTVPEDTSSTTLDEATAPAATDNASFRSQPTACGADLPPEPQQLSFSAPEDQEIPEGAAVTATITTSCGDLTLVLDPVAAPETVNSFVFLARQGYFEGTAFHRIIPTFMMQGGDPTGTGTGGPGYTLPDELPADNVYPAGTVAMANAGPGTGGSQFFIVFEDTPLPLQFSSFGRIEAGQDVLESIRAIPLGFNLSGEQARPLESLYIEQVNVEIS